MYPCRPNPVQLDLFGPNKGSQRFDTPSWETLPQPTRRRATVLMTRLFLEHCQTEADTDHDLESDDV